MNYFQVEGISKSFGEKQLFDDISFVINRGDKKALVAKNGAGKTSLINILMGRELQDNGKITIRTGLKVGYLEQDPKFDESHSVYDVLYNTDNKFIQAINAYHIALENYQKKPSPTHQTEVDKAISQMDILQAWDYETKIAEILTKFGISDMEQNVATLSGGQRKKVGLARVLIDDFDLLILDEPTNHLDLEMIRWLEGFLEADNITLFMVTHDRYFLNNVCSSILELSGGSLYAFNGNYSYYVEKKAEMMELERRVIEKAQNIYRTELEWMRRMPKARATKSKSRIESFHELEEVAKRRIHDDKIEFKVNSARLGHKILELYYITKSFEEKTVVNDFSYIFKHGEKIGIAGPNGSGKSTLLNIITGNLKPDKGKVTIGQTVQFGYYRQEGFVENQDRRVIDIMKDIAEEVAVGKGTVSTAVFLQHFGFSFSEQYAYFSTLSGGEKRKLYLLMVLMQNPNFLILDEPTNDLDIATLNALEDFLADFKGCILIVSHDRWFMDKLSDHIFAFEEDGKIKDFPGNYTQYLEYKERQELNKKKSLRQEQKMEYQKPKNAKPSQKYFREAEQLEKEIAALEEEKQMLTEKFSEEASIENMTQWSTRIGELIAIIDEKTERWMNVIAIIEDYENNN
ncbi:MAG: ABC-F family ATP-binding cassette domain-containing protein [Bacteroidales bacterium]|jgi:ATP-binding cassette subfamily F protein uup|nr:ABC-F family ATP-binding cassette domain-containing protein [Bacteroidales bacterium]